MSRLEAGLTFLGEVLKGEHLGDTLEDLTIPGDLGASW